LPPPSHTDGSIIGAAQHLENIKLLKYRAIGDTVQEH